MSDEPTTTQPDDAPSNDDMEWGSPIRVRKGTRRRLEGLVELLTSYPGVASLPEEVRVVFRDAFSNSRNSFSPDVLIDTAVAAINHMLTSAPPEPEQPERRKTTKGKGR